MDTPPPEIVSKHSPVSAARPTKLVAVVAFLLATVSAFVLFANVRNLGAPPWPAVAIAAFFWLGLPALWHVFAERQRKVRGGSAVRLLSRCLAVNLLVAAGAVAAVGPKGVWARVQGAFPRGTPEVASEPAPAPPLPDRAGDGLEGFVPGDATWALSVSGSEALMKLLEAHGEDTQDKLQAMQKCHIQLGVARAVIAARGPEERMALIRAPGISDEGNLYCLVGAMGAERLVLKFDHDAPRRRFTVTGLWSNTPLTFTEVGPETLLMVAPAWQAAVDERLAGRGTNLTQGLLAAPYGRLDAKADLWAASVTPTPEGPWDMALQAGVNEGRFQLTATSVPPTGADSMARAELHLPLAYVHGLPGGAFMQGAACLVSAAASTGAAIEGLPPGAVPEKPAL